jgi:hypothetical protein
MKWRLSIVFSLPAGFTTLGKISHELHPRVTDKGDMILKWIRESYISYSSGKFGILFLFLFFYFYFYRLD